jgi:hypothetical protein
MWITNYYNMITSVINFRLFKINLTLRDEYATNILSSQGQNTYKLNSTERVINNQRKTDGDSFERCRQYYQSGNAGIFYHFIWTASVLLKLLRLLSNLHVIFSLYFISWIMHHESKYYFTESETPERNRM